MRGSIVELGKAIRDINNMLFLSKLPRTSLNLDDEFLIKPSY